MEVPDAWHFQKYEKVPNTAIAQKADFHLLKGATANTNLLNEFYPSKLWLGGSHVMIEEVNHTINDTADRDPR